MRLTPSRSSALAGAAAVAVLASALVATPVGAEAGRLITGKDIRNNSVSGKKIKNQSITSVDIKNGTLRAKDFAPGVLPTQAPTSAVVAPAAQPTVVQFKGRFAGSSDTTARAAQQSRATIPAFSSVQPLSFTFGPELAAACPAFTVLVYVGDGAVYSLGLFGAYRNESNPVTDFSFPSVTNQDPEALTVQATYCGSTDPGTGAYTPLPVPAFDFDVRVAYTTTPPAPTVTFDPGTQVTPSPGPFSRGAEPVQAR